MKLKLLVLVFFAILGGCDVSVSNTATGGSSEQEQDKPAEEVVEEAPAEE